jgi:hypothetical protein
MPGYPSGLVESSRLWKNRARIKTKNRRSVANQRTKKEKQVKERNKMSILETKKAYGDFRGFHHAYLGMLIFLCCFILGFVKNFWWGAIGCPIGLLIALDDVAQQFWFVKDKTPLRLLNNWLWRNFSIYQKLCNFFDKLFGKK